MTESPQWYLTQWRRLYGQTAQEVQSYLNSEPTARVYPGRLEAVNTASTAERKLKALNSEVDEVLGTKLNSDIKAVLQSLTDNSQRIVTLNKQNNQLTTTRAEEDGKDTTAQGLYNEERNLFNIELLTISMYVGLISLLWFRR